MDDAGREQAAGIQIKVLLELQNLPITYRDLRGEGGNDETYDAIAERYLRMILRELRHSFELQQELREGMDEMNLDWPERPKLDNINLYMKANIAAELRERGSIISILDLEGFKIRHAMSRNLSQDDFEVMTEMYLTNYRDYPELQEALEEAFIEKNKRISTEYQMLYVDGEMVAFDQIEHLGFDEKGRVLSHFGAMNVAPDLKGAFLGDCLMDVSVGIPADHGSVVRAECDADAAVTRSYLNRRKFVGTAFDPDFHGIAKLDIVIDPDIESRLTTREVSLKEAREMLGDAEARVSTTVGGHDVVVGRSEQSSDELPWHLLKEGYVLTHLYDGEDQNPPSGGSSDASIGVFEKIS
jgi:hypothetical protein